MNDDARNHERENLLTCLLLRPPKQVAGVTRRRTKYEVKLQYVSHKIKKKTSLLILNVVIGPMMTVRTM
jgi:hypothetical protein